MMTWLWLLRSVITHWDSYQTEFHVNLSEETKGWTKTMPSSITRYEKREMAKDVIASLKSYDYTDDEIHFILTEAIDIIDSTEPYFEEDE